MSNSSCSLKAFKSPESVAVQHVTVEDKATPLPYPLTVENGKGAGGIYSTASDMAKWIQYLLSDRTDIISKKQLAEIFSPHAFSQQIQ